MRDDTKAYGQLFMAADAPPELQRLAPDAVWFLLAEPNSSYEREIIDTMRREAGIGFEAHAHSHPDGRVIWIGRKIEPLLTGLLGQPKF